MLDDINIIDDKIVNDLRTQPVKKLFEYDNTIVDKIAEAYKGDENIMMTFEDATKYIEEGLIISFPSKAAAYTFEDEMTECGECSWHGYITISDVLEYFSIYAPSITRSYGWDTDIFDYVRVHEDCHGMVTIKMPKPKDIKDEIERIKNMNKKNWIEGLPAFKKIDVYNDRVVKVTFIDDTFTKSVCSPNDQFDLDVGITICCMKRLLGNDSKDGNRVYNNIIRLAHKQMENNEKQDKLKAEEEKKRKAAEKKRAMTKKAKMMKAKEEQIDIVKQGYLRALTEGFGAECEGCRID